MMLPSADRLPSLVQILNGTPPANNEPIRVTFEPGSAYRYSGGGYEVVEQLLEDVAGTAAGDSYAALVQARVFDRSGMSRSSLFDPLDTNAAATGHDENGRVLAGRSRPDLVGQTVSVLWESTSELGEWGWRMEGLTENYLRVAAVTPSPRWNQIDEIQLTHEVETGKLYGIIKAKS